MLQTLVNFFGLSRGEQPADAALSLHGIGLGWLLVLTILLIATAWFTYARAAEQLPRWRRSALALLRVLFLLLILTLLARPVLSLTHERLTRSTVLLLIDSSASMSAIVDHRWDANDLKRAALAKGLLDPAKGLDQPLPAELLGAEKLSRIELVQAALRNARIDLLNSFARRSDVAVYRFDRSAEAVETGDSEQNAWIEQLPASGDQTALGDAIRQAISRKRGQNLAGIVLITDGAANSGLSPLDASRLARQDAAPLFIWGVGITSPRDIAVGSEILTQDIAFVRDKLPVTVRVRSIGLAGQSAKLRVTLGEESAEKDVRFAGDGEQLVSVELTPEKPGQFDLRAEIQPLNEEVVKENNAASRTVRVIDGRIKVLLVEQFPRWEFKYIQQALLRDRRIELRCWLVEGDESIALTQDSPYINAFPKTKEDLFKHDLVILGDLDPSVLPEAQQKYLGEFVAKFGGAVAVIAGRRNGPQAWRRTPIEKMLPVELEMTSFNDPPANRPIALELTAAGKSSDMLRLAGDELENVRAWAQLPPIYWVARVMRSKPAAEVLLVDPDPSRGSRYGKMPAMAIGQYGMGQVLYVGTDNFWRWRKNDGEETHARLWGQIVQRLTLPRLLGESRRTQLSCDRREYAVGAPIAIYARLYTESFEPMTPSQVAGMFASTSGQHPSRVVQMRSVPDQPGMYRGVVAASTPGEFMFSADHDPQTKLSISVARPQQELTEPAMNESLLRQMASLSGGEFLREEDLASLPERIHPRDQRTRTTATIELAYTWPFLLLMLAVVTAEWILRKRSQLK